MSFDVKNLRQVEDLAAKHGFSDTQEARFPRGDLNAESIGLAYLVVRPASSSPSPTATRRRRRSTWCCPVAAG